MNTILKNSTAYTSEDLILKAAKSSGANKAEILHGSLFVTFTPGFVDVISNELKNVLEKLLKDTRKQFVRSGALLDDSQKKQITRINSKISELSTEFGQNLLAETNGFELILNKDGSHQLPDFLRK